MITVVIPVSPIKQHPEVSILETTVASVRHWLPDAEIILTFDGVRAEQEDRRRDYEEAIRKTLWWADKAWGNVAPYIFDEHKHQTGMLRHAIDDIRTPYLLYVEQDTPLVTDEPIDWETILVALERGIELVRFHHEAAIPAEHDHMMLSPHIFNISGTRHDEFVRTCQWSQRPHVASVAFYRRVLDRFSPDAKAFIEDRMHGVCHEAYRLDGVHGWRQWPLTIFHPPGGNIKRSYHLDGRAGEAKFDDSQRF